MELFDEPIALLMVSVLLLIAVTKIVATRSPHQQIMKNNYNTKIITTSTTTPTPTLNLPPGPWKLPLLGNMHNLIFSPTILHRAFHQMALKHGPLMHLKLGQVSVMVISSAEVAKEVLKDHDVDFAQRAPMLYTSLIFYGPTDIILSPYGAYWRQVRKICQMELMSPNRVQSFGPIRRQEVADLIASIKGHCGLRQRFPVNLSKMIFQLTYSITSRSAFGMKYKDQDLFISLVRELIEIAPGLGWADLYPSIGILKRVSVLSPKFKRVFRETDRLLVNIINHHRSSKGFDNLVTEDYDAREDLVDILLKMQANGDLEFSLSDDNIKSILLDIFSAGSDTSSTTIEWVMSELLKNPSTMEKAQAEIREVFNNKEPNVDEEAIIHKLPFLKCCIKEALRLHPPVALIPRQCRQSCKISGYDIPDESLIYVNAWSLGHDPHYWDEAERFFPERFLNNSINYTGTEHFEFIPFGAGRRICPGMSFGLANVELPLAKLLYHFDWELPHGMKHHELCMNESFGIALRREKDLIVIPTTTINPLMS